MNCPACGALVSGDEALCGHCGAALSVHNGIAVVAVKPLPPFFPVPVWKLALMSLVTFGLYEFYWFNRNWQRIRVREDLDIRPSLRALFSFFFCYACCARIKAYGVRRAVVPAPPIALLSLAWMLIKLCVLLPEPLRFLSLFGFLPLLGVQVYVNRINSREMPEHDRNARLTGWNWVGIVVGGGVWTVDLLWLFLMFR